MAFIINYKKHDNFEEEKNVKRYVNSQQDIKQQIKNKIH